MVSHTTSILTPGARADLDGPIVKSGVTSICLPGPNLDTSPLRGRRLDRAEQSHAATKPPRRFVMGSENSLADVAVRELVDGTGRRYNPLVLCGTSGVGKSHLALGLTNLWRADATRGEAIYTTAADFARDFAAACDANLIDKFRRRHRSAALWVLEDIGDLATKKAAQFELIHTLDALIDLGAWVVVTSRVPIALASRIESALISRLSAGLVVSLAPPAREARLEILRDLAATRDIRLAEPVAQLLASSVTGTVPELGAVLLELQTSGRATGKAVDVDMARSYLASRDRRAQPSPGEIIALSARYFSLTQAALRSKTRTQSVVLARGVAMYLLRSLTTESLQQIGRRLGGRDHTTVLHQCRKIERLVESDPEIQRAVDELRRLLTNISIGITAER